MSKFFDVVIIGGGPAGSAASITLSRAGRKVLLIDATSKKISKKVGESLPGSAKPLLAHLDLLQIVEDGKHLVSYGNSSSWGSEELITTDFIQNPQGPGWHLDRVRFDKDLRKVAKSRGVTIKNDRMKRLKRIDGGWEIYLGKSTVKAKWIIDVTGRSALVAKSQSVTRQRDDALAAIYTWLPLKKKDQDSRTLIESTPQGWWYTAKLPDKSRVVVFHTEAKDLNIYLKSPAKWLKQLSATQHVRAMLGPLPKKLKLNAHEACGAQLKSFYGKGWIAAGDAAISFDPLSSQGIFNALYTGLKAAEAVDKALDNDDTGLARYSEELKKIRDVYLARRKMFYSQEQRWQDQPFWKSRS